MGRKSNAQKKMESSILVFGFIAVIGYVLLKKLTSQFHTDYSTVLIYALFIILLFSFLKGLIRALSERKILQIAKNIVSEHKRELMTKRFQNTVKRSYNLVDTKKWEQEKIFFIKQLIIPRINKPSREVLQDILNIIEFETEDYKNIQPEFNANMSPYEYEHYVANLLKSYGWDSYVTKSSGDQGIDVIASKNGIRIVAQCKLYSQPVGNKAVQEIASGKIFEKADIAVVVTNNSFTKSAEQLATSTGVKLLHHSQLQELDKVFEK